MKKFKFQFITVILVCFAFIANTANAQQKKVDKYSEVKIKTSSQCNMCKETIEKAMAFEKGVKTSELDVKTKILTVKYDAAKTSPEKIRIAVSKAGYDADDVKADAKAYSKLSPCCKKDGHK